jgi:glutathione S-transferase
LVIRPFLRGLKLPKERGGAKVEQMARRYREEGSVVRTISKREHHLPMYQRYADDTAESDLAKAISEGNGVA